MKINEFGRSMIEMLGVLAIIGVLSAAGLLGYQKAMQKHKINKTMNQMATIVNNMHTAFTNAQSDKTPYKDFCTGDAGECGTGLCDATLDLINLNIFPAEMVRTENSVKKVYNVYQAPVRVCIDADGSSFELQFDGLPKEASIATSTIDWGLSDRSGLQEVDIANEGGNP